MASLNPALLIGYGERKGSLAVGKDADLIVIDEDINVYAAMRKGEWMFGKDDLQ
jgi:N-acetylglucosamine-6-phosphate deacetylase